RQVARDQRRLLGPAIARLGQSGALWVRAALAGGDAQHLMADANALVRPLAGGGAVSARPVAGPPTATPGAASIDRYFALPRAAGFSLGQRVLVELPLRGGGAEGALSVPASAILTDINGGEWVYVETAPNAFERRRVEVSRIAGDRASLARGPAPGARVVTAGAAELFGTEFGTK
ncbi:MAG: efflux RND transporter periplasmic adaptor subunit, partial [Sphingomonas sp.]|nr:efflux RND transporter periplasmic adaptor subunit [Sphingomonas sp.]